jgi:hypothetical protein
MTESTESFVSELRARPKTIQVATPGADAITIRVEMPEVWDTVRVVVSPRESVLQVKVAALEALFPESSVYANFVVKYRGWEILDETASLVDAGIGRDAILLVTHRGRRPVR